MRSNQTNKAMYLAMNSQLTISLLMLATIFIENNIKIYILHLNWNRNSILLSLLGIISKVLAFFSTIYSNIYNPKAQQATCSLMNSHLELNFSLCSRCVNLLRFLCRTWDNFCTMQKSTYDKKKRVHLLQRSFQQKNAFFYGPLSIQTSLSLQISAFVTANIACNNEMCSCGLCTSKESVMTGYISTTYLLQAIINGSHFSFKFSVVYKKPSQFFLRFTFSNSAYCPL